MLALITALLATVASALNLGGNIRLYANFTPAVPLLSTQWNISGASLNSTIEAGVLQGSNVAPLILRTDIHYCTSADFVLQMNARIQYDAIMGAGSTINSLYGWNEDPMYGCAWTGAMNEDGWRFQFLITKTKVYALYAHYPAFNKSAKAAEGVEQVEDLPARLFAYIVPIFKTGPTEEGLPHDYSVNMKAGEYDVSWRIDNVEKLIIRNVGQTISSKFLVWSDSNTFVYQPVDFPQLMRMEIGVGSMMSIGPIGQPNTVCQRAVWDMCTQNLFTAPRCFCRYGSIQDPNQVAWELFQTATTNNVFIARLSDVQTCLDGGVDNNDSTADHWWTRN